jgi:hypothetical protein
MNDCPGRGPGPRPPQPRRARVAAVITVTAATLLAAACSGSPSSTGPGGSPAAGGSASSPSALAFSQCVRSHGIPGFPDPDSNGQFSKEKLRQVAVSASRLRAVEDTCQNLLPAGPPPLTAQDQQDYLKAAACMRSHALTNFPDPTFSDGSVSFDIPSSIDTGSQRFIQARQTCEKLIPAGLPDSGRG